MWIMQDLKKVLEQSWDHYKKHKIDPVTNRPLSTPDSLDFGASGNKNFMTFSETVAYVLFRAVWMNDKQTFDKVWEWASTNMWRKNIREVFCWQINQWGDVPYLRKDNLFAWRYVNNIKRTGQGGIIFFKWDPNEVLWRDGLDSSPIGDELIATSLILAHCLWGSQKGDLDYLLAGKAIVSDIWNKCVKKITPGVIDTFPDHSHLKPWFIYNASDTLLTKTLSKGPSPTSTAMEINYYVPHTKWAGVGRKIDNTDLSSLQAFSFTCKGEEGHKLKIILRGKNKQNTNDSTDAFIDIMLSANWKDYSFNLSDFKGTEKIDWGKINSIFFQVEDNNNKGFFAITDIKVIDKDEKAPDTHYHLTSNDKGEPWINTSYYLPFVYNSLFKKIDPHHNWQELNKTAYIDAELGSKATLFDEENIPHTGNIHLIPDWFALTPTGKPANIPWANNLYTNDYMHGKSATRFDFFVSLDYIWNNNPLAKKYIYDTGPYNFYKKELEEKDSICRGYAIDGKIMKFINQADKESCGSYGNYLSLFSARDDKENANKILNKIMQKYNKEGYWGNDPLDYYDQNWTWLGVAFFADRGLQLRETIEKNLT